jgi:L-rhamnose isomerase
LVYLDASINRIAAWGFGITNARKAILNACSRRSNDPRGERAGDFTERFVRLEDRKDVPFGAVWRITANEGHCAGRPWLDEVQGV